MSDPLMDLLALCFTMFVGAYGSGVMPMVCALSDRVKRAVSVFGCGLLIGAALIVIIPEGIQLYYTAAAAEEAEHAKLHVGHDHDHAGGEGSGSHEHHDEHQHSHGHWQIGASLVAGFALMLVIDRAGGGHSHGHGHDHGHAHGGGGSSGGGRQHSDGSSLEEGEGGEAGEDVHTGDDEAGAAGGDTGTGESVAVRSKNNSAMVGLLFHSAADGVAMGAACFSNSGGMEMVVFLAIMLHKMPAALGFSSYLVQQNLPDTVIKQRLLMFAGSAPAGALVTFQALSMGIVDYAQKNLAICLMVSGGTFLYVATAHILPEVQAAGQTEARPDDNKPGAPSPWSDVWLMIAGMVLPLLINVEHSH